ncbi:SDR family oxidoreductase [Natronolimnohabitans innermongolicus]|uniref:Dehydrogenase n=1 Tax=Natronolimnohabitans innermongolicus JCM 12255 TaxID=1227499 RepID=L9WNE3_9EURY|nr:SDR family oxidoreductase [Natronolimnohabitans innermongolicus]ELY50912.1 dehydrogenase [Natronolimnohabitans innermongolicus JCM 12255]
MTAPAYLVVGGAHGLGEATARELAQDGANVVVSDLGTTVDGSGSDPDAAEETAAAIDAEVDDATAVAHFGDAADADDAAAAIETALESFDRLDGIANFAGILRDGMSWSLSDEEWDDVVRTHLRSNFTLLRSAVTHWRDVDDDSERSFLAVSSRGALGNVGQLAYASANAGILGFVRAASSELDRQNVRVNALVPNGYTRMTESVPEEHRPYTREEMPPEKVAPAAAYLLSEAADDVTGVTVTARGDEIGILSEPRQIRTAVAEDGWDVDAVDEAFDAMTDGYETTRTETFL